MPASIKTRLAALIGRSRVSILCPFAGGPSGGVFDDVGRSGLSQHIDAAEFYRAFRERVSELGGTCVTENRVRGGACISVWLPLEDKEKWL